MIYTLRGQSTIPSIWSRTIKVAFDFSSPNPKRVPTLVVEQHAKRRRSTKNNGHGADNDQSDQPMVRKQKTFPVFLEPSRLLFDFSVHTQKGHPLQNSMVGDDVARQRPIRSIDFAQGARKAESGKRKTMKSAVLFCNVS